MAKEFSLFNKNVRVQDVFQHESCERTVQNLMAADLNCTMVTDHKIGFNNILDLSAFDPDDTSEIIKKCVNPNEAINIGINDCLKYEDSEVSLSTIDESDLVETTIAEFFVENQEETMPLKKSRKISSIGDSLQKSNVKREANVAKRKLYEEGEIFDDPAEERKRINAVNAKRNRDIKLVRMENLNVENEQLRISNEDLQRNLELLKVKYGSLKKSCTIGNLMFDLIRDKCKCSEVENILAKYRDEFHMKED